MEDSDPEKDSTASLRAAELARRLNKKEEEDKVNKSIKEIVEADLRKAAGGEGSRGGKIIGHTKSGKPVYSNGMSKHGEGIKDMHPSKQAPGWSSQDHRDAAAMHSQKALEAKKQASVDEHKSGNARSAEISMAHHEYESRIHSGTAKFLDRSK